MQRNNVSHPPSVPEASESQKDLGKDDATRKTIVL
jgi:hypothetical protein